MRWDELLHIVDKEPVFSSSLLTAGSIDPIKIGTQLSRWVKSGKLVQIRRGLYALSERYRKTDPHPFHIANRIQRASYVSLQSALEYYGLIPEYVPAITSVTTGRPRTLETPLGIYIFRHIKSELFFDYAWEETAPARSFFIASPEKALLDLLYLTPGSDDPSYLEELRLQNRDRVDQAHLRDIIRRTGSSKLTRALDILGKRAEEF